MGRQAGQNFASNTARASKKVIPQMSLTGKLAGKAFAAGFLLLSASRLANAFSTFAKMGEHFNRRMRNSMAIMGKLSKSMRRDLAEAALKAASTTQFAAEETAQAYFYLVSAGLSAQQSIAALPQVAKFAQAGMFDMAKATSLAANAQSAMGLKVKDAQQNLKNLTRVTDVLVKANTLADATTQQFSEAITTKAGGAARIAGKSIEELVATLAALADQGVKGAEGGTALNIVYRDLQTKSLKFAANFEKLGIRVWNTNGSMRKMYEVIKDLEDAFEGLSAKQRKQALLQLGFQDRSVVFTQLLIGMSKRMKDFEKELDNAGGTTKKVAANQLTLFQKGLAKVRSSLTRVSSGIAKAVGPAFYVLGTAISTVINTFSLFNRILFGLPAKFLVTVAALALFNKAMLLAKVRLLGIGSAVALSNLQVLIRLLDLAKMKMIALGVAAGITGGLIKKALITTGIGAVVVAIGYILYGLISLVGWLGKLITSTKTFSKFTKMLAKTWTWAVETIGSVLKSLGKIVGAIFDFLTISARLWASLFGVTLTGSIETFGKVFSWVFGAVMKDIERQIEAIDNIAEGFNIVASSIKIASMEFELFALKVITFSTGGFLDFLTSARMKELTKNITKSRKELEDLLSGKTPKPNVQNKIGSEFGGNNVMEAGRSDISRFGQEIQDALIKDTISEKILEQNQKQTERLDEIAMLNRELLDKSSNKVPAMLA